MNLPDDEVHVGPGLVPTVGEAMRRLPGGGHIVLHDGLYEESVVVQGKFLLRAHGDARPVLRGLGFSTIEIYGGFLHLEDLIVEAPAELLQPAHAIHVVTAGELVLHRCRLRAATAAALAAEGRQTVVRASQCKFDGAGKTGVLVFRWAKAHLEEVEITAAGLAGVEATSMAQVSLERSKIRECRQDGVVAKGAGTRVVARGSDFLNNGYSGLTAIGSAGIEAEGCIIGYNRQVGVLAADGGRALLRDNTFLAQWRGAWLGWEGGMVEASGNTYAPA